MTQQIRKNVFETNSSSSHSLTLSPGDLVKQPFNVDILRLGTLTLPLGEYNWEWFRYYELDNKAQYLMTQLFHYDGIPHGDPETVTRELRADTRFDMLCRVIEEHTGVKLQVEPGSRGGIDHDSVGNGLEVFESEDKLRQFLFSPDSYIETGNDNSGPGKIIGTDRGDQHYYIAHYREPAQADVMVKLHVASSWSFDELRTDAGALLSEESNAELYQAVRAQATVTSAFFDCQSWYHPFEYGSPQGDTMSSLSDAGLSFSPDVAVEVKFKEVHMNDKENKTYTRVALTAYMPKHLAEQLAALPKSEPAETPAE
jgi:hypothetical protein